MKSQSLSIMTVIGSLLVSSISASPIVTSTGSPIAFTQNVGQWPDSILFRGEASGGYLWFVKSGVYHQLVRSAGNDSNASDIKSEANKTTGPETHCIKYESVMLKKTLLGANQTPNVCGELEIEYKCNFFKGNDPSKWRADVPNFEEIRYVDIYPGIDLRFYGKANQLEYDFIVSPGADYRQIRFQFENPEALALKSNGDLQIGLGGIGLTERTPVIYQEIDGLRQIVVGQFSQYGERQFGFSVADPVNPEVPLVIDPSLAWSTYLGGSVELPFPYIPRGEEGNSIAVGADGSVFVTGSTPCSDFPMMNPLDNILDDGSSPYPADDAFVTKFNPSGTALVYSTYLGGNRYERPYDIAVDASGNAYIVGETGSYDYPLMNPYQATAGFYDAFVTKLSPAGNSLIYSTRLGGSCCTVNYSEVCTAVAVDALGFAYVCGGTASTDFPTTAGAYQTSGPANGFVAKLNQAGTSLVYSTLLGATSGQEFRDIAVDATGNAWVTGRADGINFPMVNPLKVHIGNGNPDAILAEVSADGSSLLFSTYWGSETGWEDANSLAIDAAGCIYVTGSTGSVDFPLKEAFDTLFEDGEAWVTKFATNGDSTLFSTYIGGDLYEEGHHIAVQADGGVTVVGRTNSTIHFPIKYPLQGANAGGYDFFVTQLCAYDHAPVYSTYLGGPGDDGPPKAAVDNLGNVYAISTIYSTSPFPMIGAYDNTLAGTSDALIFKMTGLANGPSCCLGQSGNIDCDPCNRIDIADIARLIDYEYISFNPLCCVSASNTDADAGVDIADITALINYLYVDFVPTATCP